MSYNNSETQALYDHLLTGATTTCRCWMIERKDGWKRGFTDHDRDLVVDRNTYLASTGLTASALETTTGISVNNTETIGAISDVGITEDDIESGRFDRATITCFLVNWKEPNQRLIRFTGSLGQIARKDSTFTAELLGMTECLNQPQGRVYQRDCSAVLGDSRCRFNTNTAGYYVELPVVEVEEARVFRFDSFDDISAAWFERGRLLIRDGIGEGLWSWIKNDLVVDGQRELTLWQGLRADIRAGDLIRLEAGCDKSASTCAAKFGNFKNFRGCPHIPGEDWLTSYPRSGEDYGGGSMNVSIV
ncbi:DUF2163 domain-containing protein [Tropicimonas sp. TH_r6]|uniref:DUF2163 domain-containing protein n=1 Tax=Tropicimonas sp. TH_r6 TaxID=3082085 RepID=UPI0029536D0F|nr:DUF2163 domain-containing protein [Tropicimonas sp. TH_r6]MDV7145085.1 DUF2163 domain-containing protein [Tropicimonas sp. TH_r6]